MQVGVDPGPVNFIWLGGGEKAPPGKDQGTGDELGEVENQSFLSERAFLGAGRQWREKSPLSLKRGAATTAITQGATGDR